MWCAMRAMQPTGGSLRPVQMQDCLYWVTSLACLPGLWLVGAIRDDEHQALSSPGLSWIAKEAFSGLRVALSPFYCPLYPLALRVFGLFTLSWEAWLPGGAAPQWPLWVQRLSLKLPSARTGQLTRASCRACLAHDLQHLQFFLPGPGQRI